MTNKEDKLVEDYLVNTISELQKILDKLQAAGTPDYESPVLYQGAICAYGMDLIDCSDALKKQAREQGNACSILLANNHRPGSARGIHPQETIMLTINITCNNATGNLMPEATQSALIGAVSDVMDEHHPGIGAIHIEIEDTTKEEA